MYNIRQAAARAGVTVPVLRAWERRYGIIDPARTASGYRLFDDATVARIATMRGLVDQGWSPSTAAAAIIDGSVRVVVGAGSPPTRRNEEPLARTDDIRGEAAEFSRRFVEAARSLEPDAVSAVLDDLFARGSFERVTTDLLVPALESLGAAWAAGELGIAGEHLASSAVHRRLALALEAAGGSEGRGQAIIVGMPPGGRHELGVLTFAIAARRAGLSVTYLGADLPADDWVSAAKGAAAAVIGIVVPHDRAAARDVARRLHAEHPRLVIAFGGRLASPAASVLLLPAHLTDAVGMIREAIAAARSGVVNPG